MRALLLAALIVGCAETPPQYIGLGQTKASAQRAADAQCERWLAHGVESGQEGPLVLGRHIHRDPRPVIRATGAACAYEWKSHECRCMTMEFHNDYATVGERGARFVTGMIYFNACGVLHSQGAI